MGINNKTKNSNIKRFGCALYALAFFGSASFAFFSNTIDKKENISLKEKTSIENKIEKRNSYDEPKTITLTYRLHMNEYLKENQKQEFDVTFVDRPGINSYNSRKQSSKEDEETNINFFDFGKYYNRVKKYEPFIEKLSDIYGIPKQDIISLGIIESSFIHDITSNAGAVGIMQLLPSTAEEVCGLSREELENPYKNMNCGVKYFNNLINYFEGIDAKHRSKEFALISYNWGVGNVRRALSSHIIDNKITDPNIAYYNLMYSGKIPKVTKDYVEKFNQLTKPRKIASTSF